MTRGERNCNPLNIRLTADRWLGMKATQTDKSFVQFETIEYGIRAAIHIIRRYIRHYSCSCIRDIIRRWAPASENDTESYIRYVSEKTCMNPADPIRHTDVDSIARIISAMAFYESRMNIPKTMVESVWKRFF